MKKNNPKTPIISGRTRFARDIVAEFWMPRKPTHRAVILLDGCPSVPSKRKVGEFFARKGYWVFHPRYRGSWESAGRFLRYPPCDDAILVAGAVNKGFADLWSRERYVLDVSDITVIGASFGGAAALLASLHPAITRVIALAPPVDLAPPRNFTQGESTEEFLRQIHEGFGGAYRLSKSDIPKLRNSRFYNPMKHLKEFDPKKIFIAHALDDTVVPVGPLRKFAKSTKVKPFVLQKGGHFSTSAILRPEIWEKAKVFLKK